MHGMQSPKQLNNRHQYGVFRLGYFNECQVVWINLLLVSEFIRRQLVGSDQARQPAMGL
ncbi:hypothetical protein SAMN05216255_2586 [Pseudomonas segetis]|uniref:Uncharacterized protein n=1 Tax=Pseudomonas segetis TaxID=298908 RepID=A0A239FFJ4_9PSED|nr:hypothetical protein SAMN05216255_2586 [Pseudomonas segetis]